MLPSEMRGTSNAMRCNLLKFENDIWRLCCLLWIFWLWSERWLILPRTLLPLTANLITAKVEWAGSQVLFANLLPLPRTLLYLLPRAKMNGREGLTWLYFVRVKVHGRTANEPNALRGVIGKGWGWRTDAVKTDLGEFVSQIYLGIARTCTHTARTTIHIHVRQASNIFNWSIIYLPFDLGRGCQLLTYDVVYLPVSVLLLVVYPSTIHSFFCCSLGHGVEFFERIQFLSAFVPLLCYWNGAPK